MLSLYHLYLFLLVSTLQTEVFSDGDVPCKLHLSGYLRGVYPFNGNLKIIFNANLYELPITPAYVDSVKGRLKMFGNDFKNRGDWSLDNQLAVFNTLNEKVQLIQVHFLPGKSIVDGQYRMSGFLDAIVGTLDDKLMVHYLAKIGGSSAEDLIYMGKAHEKYVILSNGEANSGYVLRQGGTWTLDNSVLVGDSLQVSEDASGLFYLPAVPFNPKALPSQIKIRLRNDLQFYSVHLNTGGSSLSLIPSSQAAIVHNDTNFSESAERPVKNSKRFGFIAHNYVHMWDFKKKLVAVFELPTKTERAYPIRYVPMDAYFACTREEWEKEVVTLPPKDDHLVDPVEVDPALGGLNLWMIIGGVLGVFLLMSCASWMIISRGRRRSLGSRTAGKGRGDRGSLWRSPGRGRSPRAAGGPYSPPVSMMTTNSMFAASSNASTGSAAPPPRANKFQVPAGRPKNHYRSPRRSPKRR